MWVCCIWASVCGSQPSMAEIFTATALCVALAMVADLLLLGLERLLTPWTRVAGGSR